MARKMTSKAALAEAVRRWGKQALVRDEPRSASTPEQRAEYSRRYTEIREKLKAETDKEARANLHAEEKALRVLPHRFRYSVGHAALDGLFFMVEGEGDTWEECFAKAEERDQRFKRK
jgi:hypothetical protein